MSRTLLLAAVMVAVAGAPLRAGAPALPPPSVERFAAAQVVAVGKVVAVEKDAAAAPETPGGPTKAKYTVATVKIEQRFWGAAGAKELKVGFLPPVKPDPKMLPSRYEPTPTLGEGQEVLLHLTKHPSADFYLMSAVNMPVDVTTDWGKKQVAVAARFAAILADPIKALKGDKVEHRVEAAALLLLHYRRAPAGAPAAERVPIPADENALIFKALSEGDWRPQLPRFGGPGRPAEPAAPSALEAFRYLGLTVHDHWSDPVVPLAPGRPAPDPATLTKEAFAKWRAGPGKDYQIKKLVAKKAEK